MKIIDLTRTFTASMPVFPGDKSPILKKIIDRENKIVHFSLETGMHVGTHMDGPLHMVGGGKKLSEIKAERFIAPGRLIDARGIKKIDSRLLENKIIRKGDGVLVYTGFENLFRKSEFYKNYPDLSESFARRLVDLEVKFVGMDSPSPDKAPYKVHRILLKAEILIIEGLTNLSKLLDVKEFEVIALPAKYASEAAPARVLTRITA